MFYWVVTTNFYLFFSGITVTASYFFIEVAMVLALYAQGAGRFFTIPLLIFHTSFALYYLYAYYYNVDWAWAQGSINRAFDLELVYIAGCALYRIRRLSAAQSLK